MIVDSSALLAVIQNKLDKPRVLTALVGAPALRMSVANWVEAAMVVDACRNPRAQTCFEDLIEETGIELVPVSNELAYGAKLAYAQYGRGHDPAIPNRGDCSAYGLAKPVKEPPLSIGSDFAQTDLEPAPKD